MKLTQLTEQKERPYICVHAKKGKHETHAVSSYDAAKNAAKHWGMKSTAGIDAHLAEGNYPEPRKMEVTQADKDNNTEAWKRFKAGDPRYEWKDMILSKAESYDDYHGDMSKEEYDKTVKGSQMEYTVWVGGTEVNDKWLNYEEAKHLYDKYKAQGYDDVQLDARLKEGSFWGRDDMVAKMKKDYKAAGMRKYTKQDGGSYSGTTTSDPEEWERLEADGYEWDKDYYNDIEELEAKWKAKNEGAKPDFLDLDKDGDKKEPMKKAAKDKERTDEILPAIAIGTMAGALMSDRKAKRDAEQLNAEKGDDSEEAVAARDEFLKVMDMKPKTPGPGKQIDTIKKIVADKQNMQVAFDDGKMRVDLYTASAVSQVYDAVKPETQVKIDNMLRTKAGMLKMSDFAFSKFNEGLKEGKQLDEILPALAMAARAVAPAVGQALKGVAKAAVKNPVKTAQVVKTVKSDKPVTQKAAGVAKITGVTEEELEELQAPYTGADAVIDQNGKKHKPGSSKANMIVNMKRKPAKAAVKNPVAVPLQKNKSGVKKPAPAVGRGNAVGSKATQIQPGGGSAAGKTAAANTAKIKQAKRGAMVGKVKAVGKKVGGFVKNQALKSLDRSGIGNPLAASKQYADDMVEDAIKKAEQELEEFTPKPSIPKGPMPSFKVTRVPSTKPKGQTPGDHHPPLRLKAKMHF